MEKNLLKKTLYYVVLVLLVLLAVGPFLWLLSTALKGPGENIFAYPPQFIPQHPTLQNFVSVWNKVPMFWFFLNSIVVTLLTIFFNISLSVLAGYPLARMAFKGRGAILFSILATMMIPFQVLMIPLYLICLKLNLTDSTGPFHGWLSGWLGLVLPFAVSGFGIFFVRQALVTLPKELEESAVLDGCNSWQILWHILLPLIHPTLATLAVFAFMATWGEFLWPSIILSDPTHFTLPVGLVQLQSAFSSDWKLIAAGTLLSMVPILLFFFSLQRYFVSGATSGAVKG
jgi:putative chitobiose transport system permease protein